MMVNGHGSMYIGSATEDCYVDKTSAVLSKWYTELKKYVTEDDKIKTGCGGCLVMLTFVIFNSYNTRYICFIELALVYVWLKLLCWCTVNYFNYYLLQVATVLHVYIKHCTAQIYIYLQLTLLNVRPSVL